MLVHVIAHLCGLSSWLLQTPNTNLSNKKAPQLKKPRAFLAFAMSIDCEVEVVVLLPLLLPPLLRRCRARRLDVRHGKL